MKRTKRIFQISLITLSLLGFAGAKAQQIISSHYFGQNAWMPYAIGSSVINGKLDQHWGDIKNSGASLIRYGGITADKNMPTNAQYISIIDSVRANGMEPVIQVPFNNNQFTAQQAADIVTYINITKARHIKYWIIGNEPDLGYSYSTSAQIAAYYRPFSSAMKSADPSILIVGPEIASFNRTIINGLTTPGGPDDITGTDASGRYYLDVISFHTYPFNGTQTRAQVISNLTSSYQLQDNLIYLNSRVASCNSFHNRTGASKLKTAITEANINWQNSASDNLNGLGVNSFIGGQFVAEMMGIGMKNGLDFINLWSVIEGNSTALNIGYLDRSTGAKKPMYYHFKMMADNLKGNYVDGISNQANVKSFGSQNSQQVSVMILNEDLTNNYNASIRLNSSPIAGSSTLKINIDAGIDIEYNDVIASQSSVLLTFNSSGTLIRKTEYSLSGNAMANLAPTVTEFLSTGIASNISVDAGPLDIKNVFPNPSNGKFTVELNKANAGEKNYQIQLFNVTGQEIYNKKFPFVGGKEAIELDPSIADGQYIVRVKEDEADNYLVRKIVLKK